MELEGGAMIGPAELEQKPDRIFQIQPMDPDSVLISYVASSGAWVFKTAPGIPEPALAEQASDCTPPFPRGIPGLPYSAG